MYQNRGFLNVLVKVQIKPIIIRDQCLPNLPLIPKTLFINFQNFLSEKFFPARLIMIDEKRSFLSR